MDVEGEVKELSRRLDRQGRVDTDGKITGRVRNQLQRTNYFDTDYFTISNPLNRRSGAPTSSNETTSSSRGDETIS